MTTTSEYEDLFDALDGLTLSSIRGGVSKVEASWIKEQYKRLIETGKRIGKSSPEYYDPIIYSGVILGVSIPSDWRELQEVRPVAGGHRFKCRIAKYPFAMGAVRVAYYGQVRTGGVTEWSNVVLKEFICKSDRVFDEYKNQSENSAVATFLCEEFAKSGLHSPRATSIRTVPSRILRLQQSASNGERFLNMEELLTGEFKKWTNNAGFIADPHPEVLKLARWSYEMSDGYVLLSDLQGVQTSRNEIVLTDPAVLCTDLSRFGPTNFSAAQMKICMDALNGRAVDSRVSALGPRTARLPNSRVHMSTIRPSPRHIIGEKPTSSKPASGYPLKHYKEPQLPGIDPEAIEVFSNLRWR